jgi:Helix-turn-helix domain
VIDRSALEAAHRGSEAPAVPKAAAVSTGGAGPTRRRKPLPPAPPLEAVVLTLDEAAGLLRVRRRSVDELRRADRAFAALVILIGGQPRIRRAALERWLDGRPVGAWSPMGGTRERAFGRVDTSRR